MLHPKADLWRPLHYCTSHVWVSWLQPGDSTRSHPTAPHQHGLQLGKKRSWMLWAIRGWEFWGKTPKDPSVPFADALATSCKATGGATTLTGKGKAGSVRTPPAPWGAAEPLSSPNRPWRFKGRWCCVCSLMPQPLLALWYFSSPHLLHTRLSLQRAQQHVVSGPRWEVSPWGDALTLGGMFWLQPKAEPWLLLLSHQLCQLVAANPYL